MAAAQDVKVLVIGATELGCRVLLQESIRSSGVRILLLDGTR